MLPVSLNVLTVKVGPRYGAEYVNKMRRMLQRHLNTDFEFYCITDDPSGLDEGIRTRSPALGLPGWWNKLFCFAGNSLAMTYNWTLYLDLDQVITGDLHEIVQACTKQSAFSCYADHIEYCGAKFGSAFMLFRTYEFTHLWGDFRADHQRIMKVYESGGDQVYLDQFLRDEVYYFNEDFPEAVNSYKYDILPTGLPPGDAVKIVNFHGEPKQHRLKLPWIVDNWN